MYFFWVMKQCLTLQPNHPQALTNLGNIYMEWYVVPRIIMLMVVICVVHARQRVFLVKCRNMVAAAAQYYKATLNVTTGLSAPYNNLAIIYKQQVALM